MQNYNNTWVSVCARALRVIKCRRAGRTIWPRTENMSIRYDALLLLILLLLHRSGAASAGRRSHLYIYFFYCCNNAFYALDTNNGTEFAFYRRAGARATGLPLASTVKILCVLKNRAQMVVMAESYRIFTTDEKTVSGCQTFWKLLEQRFVSFRFLFFFFLLYLFYSFRTKQHER